MNGFVYLACSDSAQVYCELLGAVGFDDGGALHFDVFGWLHFDLDVFVAFVLQGDLLG
jgi:hypothetical protein